MTAVEQEPPKTSAGEAEPPGPSRNDIWKMFDHIAPTYDKVNRVMCGGMDVRWRKKVSSFLPPNTSQLLDVATGTGDQIIFMAEHVPSLQHGIGVDMADDMLEIGRQKVDVAGLSQRITLQHGDALALQFPKATFDAVTVSFGVRNFADLKKGLGEMFRVLRPGGRLIILEGTVPENAVLRAGYLAYTRHVMPRVGGWISGDRQAYDYLNKTIETFPSGQAFVDIMTEVGYQSAEAHPLMGGAVTIYVGDRAR